VEDDTNQRRKDWTWYFHYCKYYITGNTSIVNITILVLPVLRQAASYYPKVAARKVAARKVVC
jgi:hypothetical protein